MTCPPHRWRIPMAAGPTSEGVCVKCLERKDFVNAVDDHRPVTRSRQQPPILGKPPSGFHLEES